MIILDIFKDLGFVARELLRGAKQFGVGTVGAWESLQQEGVVEGSKRFGRAVDQRGKVSLRRR